MNVAVIGAGYVGGLHLSRLLRNPEVVAVGLVEVDAQRQAAAADEFGVTAFSDVDTLLDHTSLDAAVICVPPHARDGVERFLADRGVALLIEKPLALTLAAGEIMAAHLIHATAPVVVGYQWRQLPGLPKVRELLAGHTPHLAIGHWLSSTPPTSWWGDTATAGSQFIEQATHLIDLSLHLLGPVVSVAATGSAARLRDSATGFVKAAGVTLVFANGCVGSFATCCVSPDSYRRSLEIFVDGTAVTITERACAIRSDSETIQLGEEAPDLYEREQRAFLDLVRLGRRPDGAAPMAAVAEALAALRVTDAIEQSIISGGPIAVAETEWDH